MAFPWWFPFQQSPIDKPEKTKLESVPHKEITTRKGRVVYDRKIHFWTERDVARITANYFQIQIPKKLNLNFWIDLLERATIWMLEKILYFLPGQIEKEISARLYYFARDFLAKIIDRLLEEDKLKLRNDVSGGAH